MSKIKLSFVELHNPLFLAGTNLQQKLDPKKRPMSLTYDRKEKELHIVFNEKAAIVPREAVASMEPMDPLEAGIDMTPVKFTHAPTPPPAAPTTRIKAQVGAPQGIKI